MSEGVGGVEAFGGFVLGLVGAFFAGVIIIFVLNVRLNLELIAALVVATGFALALVARSSRVGPRLRFPLYGLAAGLVISGAFTPWALYDFASHTA